MLTKVASFVRKADFVGITVKPTINSKSRITSVVGGLLSILIALCSGFGTVYFSTKMIGKTEPLNNLNQFKSDEAVINYEDSPITVKVYDKFSRRVEHLDGFDRALKMTGQLGIINTYPDKPLTVEYFEGPLKICEESMMSPSAWAAITEKGYTPWEAYCLDQSKMVDSKGKTYNGTLGLKNRYLYQKNKFIRLRVRMCDEEEDPGCLDFFREQGFLNFIVLVNNYYTDQLEYNNPVKADILPISTYISPDFHQVRYIYSKINNIITDRSILLSDTVSESYYSLSSIDNSLAGFDKKDRSILQIICSADQMISNNERRYLKIQELLANLGGFVKGMVLVAQLLSFPFSDHNLRQQIESIEFKLKIQRRCELEKSIQTKGESKISIADSPKTRKNSRISFKEHFTSYFSCFGCIKNKINRSVYLKYLDLEHIIHISNKIQNTSENFSKNNFFSQTNVSPIPNPIRNLKMVF